MAQTGFTPIQLYYSITAGASPIASSLANGELAINITDGKLFYKENTGTISVIGWKLVPTTAGGTGQTTYVNGQLLIGNSTGNTLTKATLTAGSGISVTNGTGSITLANTGVLSFDGGSTGLLPSTATTGVVSLSGTLGVGYGGTGQTTYTNGQLLIGNTTGNTLTKTTLTAGSGVSISNGAGSITISATGSGGTVTAVTGTAPVVSSGGTTPAISMPVATTSVDGYLSSTDWNTFNSKQPAGTYVTSITVTSSNGLAGTVTSGATPAITLSTSITGLLKGNGTAISAATSGTDYAPATSGSAILYGNGAGGFSSVTIGTGVSFAGGTLSATGSGGTVTSVTGTAPVVSSGGATPAISMAAATTSVNGYLTSTDWTTFNSKQAALVSGTNIKTVNGTTLLGSGDLGTISVGYGGTGLATTPTNGQLLIGNGTNYTLATISAGTGITVTNGSGSISIAQSGTISTSAPVTVTSNYSVVSTDSWIINNKTGSSLTLTLPTASTNTGRALNIQTYQAQTVISASSNVVPQAGGSAGTAILSASAGDWACLVSNGTNWVMMQYGSYNNLLLE